MYLFVDTETNGIPADPHALALAVENWPRLVQLAWSLTDEIGNELRTQAYIIQPKGFDVPTRARRRGITMETALRLGVEVRIVLKAFAHDLSNAEAFVAHNARYDERVIQAEFYRSGRRMSPFAGKNIFCTMRASTGLCKIPGGPRGYKWPKLEELHHFLFGAQIESAHDAAADVRACARCFFELKRRGIIAEVGDQDLFEEVYRLADSCAWFDTSRFVDDVHGQFEDRGFITNPQREALIRIRNMLQSGRNRSANARSLHSVK
jgi:DNA polymerase III subunit epsilon